MAIYQKRQCATQKWCLCFPRLKKLRKATHTAAAHAEKGVQLREGQQIVELK